jgi:vacuolar-type H+-ATPase subunit I/STV1
MSLIVTDYLVRDSDTAFAKDLNDAIDFMDATFVEIEGDVDAIGDSSSYLDCKEIAVGTGLTDNKRSSRYYFELSLERLTSSSVIDIGDEDFSVDGISVKKSTSEADRYTNGAGEITDFITGGSYGYSVSSYNNAALSLFGSPGGTLPTAPDGSASPYYSVEAYATEADDIVNNTIKSIDTAENGPVVKETCSTILDFVESIW